MPTSLVCGLRQDQDVEKNPSRPSALCTMLRSPKQSKPSRARRRSGELWWTRHRSHQTRDRAWPTHYSLGTEKDLWMTDAQPRRCHALTPTCDEVTVLST